MRAPVRARYRGREVLTNPPPSAGGTLIALRAGAARPRRRPAARWRSSSPRWTRRSASARPTFLDGLDEPGFAERFLANRLGSTTHVSVLDARRRRVQRDVHERRGRGDRRAGHGHPPQQHAGRGGPQPARLPHVPARAADAEHDGADRRAARRRARAGARQRRLEPHPLGDPADDRRRRRPRACAPARRSRAPRVHFEDGVVYAEPGVDARRAARPTATRSPASARRTCSSAACRRSSATRRPARCPAAATRAAAARRWWREAACALALVARSPAAARRVAGCGAAYPDLFVLTRTGSIPGARLTLLVNDGGTVRCNGGAPRQLPPRQLLDARRIATDLAEEAHDDLTLPAPPGSLLRYRLRTQDGTVTFSDVDAARRPGARARDRLRAQGRTRRLWACALVDA